MEREVDWEREAQNPPAPGRGGKRVARQGQSEPQSPGREMYQNVRTLVTVLAVLILVFTFVARIIVVSGPSMENTLQNGDAMLVWSLGYTPEQGDVVVLTKRLRTRRTPLSSGSSPPGARPWTSIMQRARCMWTGWLWRRTISRSRCRCPAMGIWSIMLLCRRGACSSWGITSDQSADSRYPEIGIVDERCVIGRVVAVIFPFSNFGLL